MLDCSRSRSSTPGLGGSSGIISRGIFSGVHQTRNLYLVAPRRHAVAHSQGVDLTDDELMEYISESTTMSKAMEEYGDRKSCAITTAKRLALFLGRDVRCG